MEREANSRLLSRIWQVLDAIQPPGQDRSLVESGCVTAASTDGTSVRVLLRLPASAVRHGELLARIESTLGDVASLDDITLRVKPYWPLMPGDAVEWTQSHGVCVASALRRLRRDGWAFDDRPSIEEHVPGSPAARTRASEQPESLRVIIHARVAVPIAAGAVPVN